MVRIIDIPAVKESIEYDALQRALGLLSELVEVEADDATIADVARYYMGVFDRWERSKEWRGKVFPCRD